MLGSGSYSPLLVTGRAETSQSRTVLYLLSCKLCTQPAAAHRSHRSTMNASQPSYAIALSDQCYQLIPYACRPGYLPIRTHRTALAHRRGVVPSVAVASARAARCRVEDVCPRLCRPVMSHRSGPPSHVAGCCSHDENDCTSGLATPARSGPRPVFNMRCSSARGGPYRRPTAVGGILQATLLNVNTQNSPCRCS